MKLKSKSKVQPRTKAKSVRLASGLLSATLLLSTVGPTIGFAAGSAAPATASITVANNKSGVKDTVTVTNLLAGDIVYVYNAATAGTLMGSGTVAEGSTEAIVEVDQVGSAAGTVYVTVKSGPDGEESIRIIKAYDSENSVAPLASAITITNEKTGSDDTVKVTGLGTGDVVTVYGSVIDSGTVADGETEVTVSKADMLSAKGGTAQISVTRFNKLESNRVSKTYASEPTSTAVAASTINIANNKTGVADKVIVTGLVAGDVVNVYKLATGGEVIGTAIVAADETTATITIDQLTTTAGSVYVSVKSTDKLESGRTLKAYDAEISTAPLATSITVNNDSMGKADTVKVIGLVTGDVVNVYDMATGGSVLETTTVAEGATEATISKVDFLKVTGGVAYVTVTKENKLESTRTAKTYVTEPVSVAPVAANITASNNKVGVADKVIVTGLVAGDVVNVYKVATGGVAIGTATVAADETSATVTIDQLTATAGSVYVSVKSTDKLESVRTVKAYDAEITAAPLATTITVTNGETGKADTVKVTGLVAGDIVNVYGVAMGGTALESATVKANETEVTISNIDMLVAKGGTAYVTVTKANKLESTRTAKTYVTEPVSVAPVAANITASNNKVGVADKVIVTGLVAGDVVNVYKLATGGEVIGTATVAADATSATVTIDQLTATAGSVYVSVKNTDKLESVRTVKAYDAEITAAPLATTITVINDGTGNADTVKVTGLVAGDIVNVYDVATGGTALETATVAESATEVTVSKVDLLKAAGGTAYVTVTKANKLESTRTAKTYVTEPVSVAPVAANITASNNKVGVADKVIVTGLVVGDVVNVYKLATGGEVIGTATVAADATSATVTIDQLTATAGSVYVSVKSTDKLESGRTVKAYDAEITVAPVATTIKVTNGGTGDEDTVEVTGLVAGDIVNVYDVATGGSVLARATVAEEATTATVSKVDFLKAAGGTAYVAVTRVNKLESVRTAKTYVTEPVSAAPVAANITASNNKAGVADTVIVTGLVTGDVVNVYKAATGGVAIGTATVAADETSATVTIDQLTATAGSVYVSVKSTDKLESGRTVKAYDAEITVAPVATTIKVTNGGTGDEDTVEVTGLVAGDIVNVYDVATGGSVLATATVAEEATTATVSKVDFLKAAGGTAYVAVTRVNKLESLRTAKTYVTEPVSAAPVAANITASNNKAGVADTVIVTGLVTGDVVNVYKAATGGVAIGTATVAADETSATVTIDQLTATAGSVYVSVKSTDKLESGRTVKAYDAEITVAPVATTIKVTNGGTGDEDTVEVTGLVAGDIVNVYDVATGGSVLATATVAEEATTATVSKVDFLKAAGGTAYVAVTRVNKLESVRTAKTYVTEPVSAAPVAANITASNNKAGVADTVIVTGLVTGDVVNVYKAATGGVAIGTATVAADETSATVTIDQLTATAGSVYVSVKSTDKLESGRTVKAYDAEITVAPVATTIKVTNGGTGDEDTVEVTGLVAGDIVNVYDVATGGSVLATATVAEEATTATVSKVDFLKAAGGTAYVAVTRVNKLESVRTAKTYVTEPVSAAPVAANITASNNKAGVADTVIVTGLVTGDVVNVYKAATGGVAIGTATVAADETSATVTIDQLTATAGSVYVSVKSTDKLESGRTVKAYDAEITVAPVATTITVINDGTGNADTVKVTGLVAGDIVNVYDVATGGTALETATVAESATEVTVSKVDLLKAAGGTAYVTVTKANKLESTRTAKTYVTEPVSVAPVAANITASNNKVGVADKVIVTGLVAGDVVNVYKVATGGEVIGTATVAADATSATVTIDQLTATAGSVYVSVKSTDKLESVRTVKAYDAEITVAPVATTIKVTNGGTGDEDTVEVTGLVAGDIVNVYDVATGGSVLATATVAEEATTATVSKVDFLKAAGGTAYVAVTRVNKLESVRTAKTYVTEPVSAAPVAANITASNNKAGVADTVIVTGLVTGDVVNVYKAATGGVAIGTATVAADETSATVTIDQLTATAGSVYVSVKSTDKLESGRTVKAYDAEITVAPVATTITVINDGTGNADTVKVTGLVAGDIVNVYDVATGGTALETATVAESATEVTVSKVDLLKAAGGTAYVTVTKANKLESTRTAKTYVTEPVSVAPVAANITASNNKVGVADKVIVTGLVAGDVVNVYKVATGGEVIGTATVAADATSATVTIDQLTATAGSVYVSVKSTDKLESVRTVKAYDAEITVAPVATTITVINDGTGNADTVKVTGLVAGDIVNVYDVATGGTALETATVAESATEVTVSKVDLLKAAGGTAYVTVTKANKLESTRTAKTYVTEPVSVAPVAANITASNNKVGVADKVIVTGLVAGDVVNVYKVATGGEVIGTATVAADATSATVTIDQLTATAGSVYVSVKSTDKLESVRTVKAYDSEITNSAVAANIVVLNNDGTADIVRVTGLEAGDVVNVYDVATGGGSVGMATVADGKTSVNVTIDQLSVKAGKVYVTITKENKQESTRVVKDYIAE
ncbi:hypothetical protein [Paenibacillus antarcticus]|nr:hypothetical protein [Paenibacillus antarcticus]